MSFYVAYNIQADFPGAELHHDTLEVYLNAKSFLNALKAYTCYTRCLAHENDANRLLDNPEEEAFYQEYSKMIDEKLVKWQDIDQLQPESFDVYDIYLTISIATTDFDQFVHYLQSHMDEMAGADDYENSWDDDEDEYDEDDNDEWEEEFDNDNSLLRYLHQIKASGEKPDPAIVHQLIDDYMSDMNDDAISLTDAPINCK